MPEAAIDRAAQPAAEAQLLLSWARDSRSIPLRALPFETLAHGGGLALAPTQYDSRASLTIDAGAARRCARSPAVYGRDAAKIASRKCPFSGCVASVNTGTMRAPANEVEK